MDRQHTDRLGRRAGTRTRVTTRAAEADRRLPIEVVTTVGLPLVDLPMGGLAERALLL